MKRLTSFVLVAIALLSGCAGFGDPKVYNNELSHINEQVNAAYNDYKNLAEETHLEVEELLVLEEARLGLIEDLEVYQEEIEAIDTIRDGADLKRAFLRDVTMLIDMTENEEKELIELWTKMANNEGDPSENSKQETELMNQINERNETSFEKMNKAQEAFAEEKGYVLEE